MTNRPEPFDPSTGEIIQPRELAADNRPVPNASHSAGTFLDLIEDGKFSRDAHYEISQLGKFLMERSAMTEKPAKGKVIIEVAMEADGDSFKMQPKVTVKKPEVPRPRSTVWQDDRGSFCRFPPNQRQFFGVPDRDDDEPRRSVRSV